MVTHDNIRWIPQGQVAGSSSGMMAAVGWGQVAPRCIIVTASWQMQIAVHQRSMPGEQFAKYTWSHDRRTSAEQACDEYALIQTLCLYSQHAVACMLHCSVICQLSVNHSYMSHAFTASILLVCRPAPGGGGGFKSPLTRMVCTPCYRAPEVVMSRGGYTEAIDMWGIGCVFGELLQRVAWIGKATTPQLQVGLYRFGSWCVSCLLCTGHSYFNMSATKYC